MTTQDKLQFLKKKFLESVYVKDAEKGYLVAESFNLAIDPDVLEFASRCWAEHYHAIKQIDAIIGLPDAGARLISVLGEMLRVSAILPSKRTNVIPGAWQDVVSYSNSSFTTSQDEILSHIGFVRAGMKVLIVDDVVANGTTAIAAVQALQAAGVDVIGLAVLFDKQWQGGITKIEAETGIEVFSLISVKEISQDNTILI